MNFRRRHPRAATRARLRDLSHWPKWWDVVFHTRPARTKARRVMREIARQEIDADDATFDPLHRPHQYYW